MRPPRYRVKQEAVVPAPWLGEDTSSAFEYLPGGKGMQLINMLPGRRGKCVLRGPMFEGFDLAVPAADAGIGGYWTANDNLLVWGADGQYHVIKYNGTSPSTFALPAGFGGPLTQIHDTLGNFVYGIQSALSVNPVPDLTKGLAKWGGGSSLVALANGPIGAAACATHLNRLFVVGGSTPGVAGYHNDTLYWTDPNWSGTDTLASWQDDVTGLTNQIVLERANEDPPVALVSWQQRLYIFRTNSVMVLTGSTPANFALRTILHLSCCSPQSIVAADDGIYFMANRGFVRYDGARATILSGDVEASLAGAALGGGGHSNISVAQLDNDFLTIAAGTWFLYQRSTGAWTELRSQALTSSSAVPLYLRQTASHVVAADSSKGLVMDYVVNPEAAHLAAKPMGLDRGVAIIGSLFTRLIGFGAPQYKTTLLRTHLNVLLSSNGAGVNCGVAIGDDTDDPTPLNLVPSPDIAATAAVKRQRTVFETLGEVENVYLSYQLNNPNNAALNSIGFEVNDALIEFQTTQETTTG